MSDSIVAGLKAKGAKPFAGFTWAAIAACKNLGLSVPASITQQASLQTRHFEPKKARDRRGHFACYGHRRSDLAR